MIILKPIGGLGNQMFQAAYAEYLVKIHNKDQFYVDLSAYENYKIRNFSLNNLYVQNDFEIVPKNIFFNRTTFLYRIYQKIIKKMKRSDVIGERNFRFFEKKNMIYNFDRYFYQIKLPNINTEENIYIYGYFQGIEYFKEFENEIKDKLRVKTEMTLAEGKVLVAIKKSKIPIAISIRIGDDYIKSKDLNVCDGDYYKKAIQIIEEKIKDKEKTYFIFSDDICKVKKEMLDVLDFENVFFVEGFSDYQSLRLMYNCKHFIISNSSFSWWGAYLSKNNEKLIISPSRWYNNSKKKPAIYYDDMILIDVD